MIERSSPGAPTTVSSCSARRWRSRCGARGPCTRTPLDAVPDISDVQVIIVTEWDGRSPDLIEDQVTYPIVTALISTPRVKTVRGFTDFGISYVYVIFEDGTDIYWARSRVVEYLQGIRDRLPDGRDADASAPTPPAWAGCSSTRSWTRAAGTSLDELRSLPGLVPALLARRVPGVAEVASIGGFVKQYQVALDPKRLAAFDLGIEGRRDGDRAQQQRRRGAPARVRRARVHGAGPRLPEVDRRHRVVAVGADAPRHARARARRRARRARARTSGAAPPISTARARSSAASSSCGSARTPSA